MGKTMITPNTLHSLLCGLLIGLMTLPSFAQRRPELDVVPAHLLKSGLGVQSFSTSLRLSSAEEPKNNGAAMVLMGILGGVGGAVTGGYIGHSMASCNPDEWFCGLGEGLVGGMIGGTLGMAAGVAAVSPHQDRFGAGFLAAAGVGVVGALAVVSFEGAPGGMILMIPASQLVATVLIHSR